MLYFPLRSIGGRIISPIETFLRDANALLPSANPIFSFRHLTSQHRHKNFSFKNQIPSHPINFPISIRITRPFQTNATFNLPLIGFHRIRRRLPAFVVRSVFATLKSNRRNERASAVSDDRFHFDGDREKRDDFKNSGCSGTFRGAANTAASRYKI